MRICNISANGYATDTQVSILRTRRNRTIYIRSISETDTYIEYPLNIRLPYTHLSAMLRIFEGIYNRASAEYPNGVYSFIRDFMSGYLGERICNGYSCSW